MARQNKTSLIKSIVGAALAGLWLVILFGEPDGPATCLLHLLCPAARGTLEVLPYFARAAWQALQASAFDHHSFPCPLQMLVSFWPLLRMMAGAV